MMEQDPYRITTLCEICDNACGFCEWSEKDNMRPVPGWDAILRPIQSLNISYTVLHCPSFICDPGREEYLARWNPERRRKELEG